MAKKELAKRYDPKAVEAKWYEFWELKGYFHAEVEPGRKRFCITIPPPNVTGELHMGHALQHTIHDTLVRWRRMQGYNTLCLPGTDHAGIPTQMKVEEELRREGLTRYDLGREQLVARVWEWKEKYGGTILRQFRALGCSYDWRRERFTLDEGYARAVLEAFVRFYQKGWIYRGERMVNWCPYCRTVISDLEVEEQEVNGHLWHIRYPGLKEGPDVVVATTRPETMLGDTGVAVHPRDERWRDAVGKEVLLPLMERPIPIVADEYADPEMGSGAVKVTPAHDPNDWEVGQRHGLPEIMVIGEDARMTEAAGRFAGLDRFECRQAVLEALQEQGFLVKVEDYRHIVPHHDKCGTIIEPLVKEQWFVRMRDLAQQAIPVIAGREVKYFPDRFRAYSLNWLENIRDWCISRQIWWGHRIPVWTCQRCGEQIVQVETPTACPQCTSPALEQDPDVLDTWFSSALWPFAVLGWPERTPALEYFHPTDLLITGRDILYLWVARMIMTALEFVGEIPFYQVFVHPTILTRDGRRMSKTLGTGLDPLDLIDKYGTDATRFSLLYQCTSTQDIRFDAEVVANRVQHSPIAEMGRNFCNKVWNATRFVLLNLEADLPPVKEETLPPLTDLADRWIVSQLHRTIQTLTQALESYTFSEAARLIYEFVWGGFCDWYVEMAKARLEGEKEADRRTVQQVLVYVLERTLRLLHPLMPFLSEELWQQLPHEGESVMVAPWPTVEEARFDEEAEAQMELLQDTVRALRNICAEVGAKAGQEIEVIALTDSAPLRELLWQNRHYLARLLRYTPGVHLRDWHFLPRSAERPRQALSATVGEMDLYLPLAGLVDRERELARLQAELAKVESALERSRRKLENRDFLEKAPAEVVARERTRRQELQDLRTRLAERLSVLSE